MSQQGRLREAVMHLQVAASLFASHIDKVMHCQPAYAQMCCSCCANKDILAGLRFCTFTLQDLWSPGNALVSQDELAQLALSCLNRTTQISPSVACSSLQQEYDIYHSMKTFMPSDKYDQKSQECLQTYQSRCQHTS